MIANVDGMISAAPTPMLARAAMRTSTDPENAADADPAAKSNTPARNMRLRPHRSPRLPATSNKPAKTRM